MQYLKDHQEYLELGGVCDATAFSRNIHRACGIIDNSTFRRIECMAVVPVQAKALCRDLIEYLATNKSVNEKGISSWSESAGVISESVSYTAKTAEEMQTDIDDMVYEYLGSIADDDGVPLLYRGCGR